MKIKTYKKEDNMNLDKFELLHQGPGEYRILEQIEKLDSFKVKVVRKGKWGMKIFLIPTEPKKTSRSVGRPKKETE